MELRQIKYFLEILESGSFTRAARNLGLTQPALSRQMNLLERELGTSLFFRKHQDLSLTKEGEILAAEGKNILEQIRTITEQIQLSATGNPFSGEFFIAAGGTIAAWVLPPVLKRIRKEHPGMQFRVFEGDAPITTNSLREGTVDLAILGFPLKQKSLENHYLFTDHLYPVVSIHHPLAKKDQVHYSDLSNEDYVFFHSGSAIRRLMEERFKHLKPIFSPHIVMELRSIESMIQSVEAGLGIGILSELSLNDKIRTLSVPELVIERDFYLVYRKNRRPGVQYVATELVKRIQNLLNEN